MYILRIYIKLFCCIFLNISSFFLKNMIMCAYYRGELMLMMRGTHIYYFFEICVFFLSGHVHFILRVYLFVVMPSLHKTKKYENPIRETYT